MNEKIKSVCSSFPNVSFLNNSCEDVEIGNIKYRILDSTLWYYTTKNKEEMIKVTLREDFLIKKETGETFSTKDFNQMLLTNADYIQKEISSNPNTKFIILTHHLPSIRLIHDRYKNLPLENVGFYTDLEYLIKKNVCLWLCGHTHMAMVARIGNCDLAVNPKGRVWDGETGFSNKAMISFGKN
jgi:hypothetical protein